MTATTDNRDLDGNGDWAFVLDIEPIPTPRPRINSFSRQAHYPTNYAAYKKQLEDLLNPGDRETLMGFIELELEFVCPAPKTSKFNTPKGDVDNYAKGVMDALTAKGFYGDDRQVLKLVVTKRFAAKDEAPHIKVWITQHE